MRVSCRDDRDLPLCLWEDMWHQFAENEKKTSSVAQRMKTHTPSHPSQALLLVRILLCLEGVKVKQPGETHNIGTTSVLHRYYIGTT